jgi:Flavin reductase like domain
VTWSAPSTVVAISAIASPSPSSAWRVSECQVVNANASAIAAATRLRSRPRSRRPLINAACISPSKARNLASLECAIAAEHPAGDHWIVVGRVEALHIAPIDEPLVFFAGGFSFCSIERRKG